MTPNKNSREILAQLISLRNDAGSNLYHRLKLADQLLSDKDWVEDPSGGGGDASWALDRLEEDCFGPEAGMSLPEMLEVLTAVPQESVWKQNRYNLKKMWLEMRERQDASRRVAAPRGESAPKVLPSAKEGPSPTQDAGVEVKLQDLREENQQLKESLKEAHKRIKEQDREIRKLRRSIKKMKAVLKDLQEV